MNRLRVLNVLARETNLSLSAALHVADALHDEFYRPRPKKYDLSTVEGLAAHARTLPAVMDALHRDWEPGHKIKAIKELRAATGVGLADAKYAIDRIVWEGV